MHHILFSSHCYTFSVYEQQGNGHSQFCEGIYVHKFIIDITVYTDRALTQALTTRNVRVLFHF